MRLYKNIITDVKNQHDTRVYLLSTEVALPQICIFVRGQKNPKTKPNKTKTLTYLLFCQF